MALTVIACLALPTPALAAPAPLPDWGVKGKPADKPADKPTAEPTGKTAELPDWSVAAKSTKPSRPGKPKKKSTSSEPSEPEPSEPTEPTEPEPTPSGPAPVEPIAADAPTSTPAPTPVTAPVLVDTHAAQQQARRGRGELITGSVFAVVGLAGVGILGAGIHLKGKAERDLKADPARSEDAMTSLRDQQKQGETLLAAGAVVGVIGMALGIALIAAGARDLKSSRLARPLARLRVAPTFGGLVLSGRF